MWKGWCGFSSWRNSASVALSWRMTSSDRQVPRPQWCAASMRLHELRIEQNHLTVLSVECATRGLLCGLGAELRPHAPAQLDREREHPGGQLGVEHAPEPVPA